VRFIHEVDAAGFSMGEQWELRLSILGVNALPLR